jgi:hypothetical protein
MSALEILERFLELGRERPEVVGALRTLRGQPLRLNSEFLFRCFFELGQLPAKVVAKGRLLERDALFETAKTRIHHAHLSTEENVPNLIQALGLLRNGVASRAVRGLRSRCRVFRHVEATARFEGG